MSYSIKVRIYQTNQNAFFKCVEKACFTKGTWSEVDDCHILTMDNSGTSGILRLKSDVGEEMTTIALGVHNYKRWCDVVTGLSSADTGLKILPQYYDGGGRAYMREKQLAQYSVKSAKGRNFEVKYNIGEGNHLEANIIIG